jgi:hypothetical protein
MTLKPLAKASRKKAKLAFPLRLPPHMIYFLKNHPTEKGGHLIEKALELTYNLSLETDHTNEHPNQQSLPL